MNFLTLKSTAGEKLILPVNDSMFIIDTKDGCIVGYVVRDKLNAFETTTTYKEISNVLSGLKGVTVR